MSIIIQFPGLKESANADVDDAPTKLTFRSRDRVHDDIAQHVAARAAYGKAVAWEAAAEFGNLPQAQIEEARKKTAEAFMEMTLRGRCLICKTPTDQRGLIDLLIYLEKNFSILPQEMCGRSLAFDLLRTMRLSLRRVTGNGGGR